MHVLVVEDDLDLAEALVDGLRDEGYAVDLAHDGSRAIGRLARTDVDLVVVDRDLPGVDGGCVVRALLAMEHPARVLVLAPDGAGEEDTLALGVDAYLAKPCGPHEVAARLRELVAG